jgi:hypothetical protein
LSFCPFFLFLISLFFWFPYFPQEMEEAAATKAFSLARKSSSGRRKRGHDGGGSGSGTSALTMEGGGQEKGARGRSFNLCFLLM